MNAWWKYVRKHAAGDSDSAVARRVGLNAASVSRWQESTPSPANVAAFARAYCLPILEAFVAAGFLTRQEAGQKIVTADVSLLSNQELAAEILARMEAPALSAAELAAVGQEVASAAHGGNESVTDRDHSGQSLRRRGKVGKRKEQPKVVGESG